MGERQPIDARIPRPQEITPPVPTQYVSHSEVPHPSFSSACLPEGTADNPYIPDEIDMSHISETHPTPNLE